MKKYVLTGGPGIGKTTVIEILASKGYAIVPEAARMIIEEEEIKESDILPWKNLVRFQEAVAERQYEQESRMSSPLMFLDRGLVDGYGYCKLNNVLPPNRVIENGKNRYDGVFLLEQLPIYQNDKSRLEDGEEALRIHRAIIDAYQEFGYELTFVPVLSPEERVEFILKHVKDISKID